MLTARIQPAESTPQPPVTGTRNPPGFLFGRAKEDPSIAKDIAARLLRGETQQSIADSFGVSRPSISNFVQRFIVPNVVPGARGAQQLLGIADTGQVISADELLGGVDAARTSLVQAQGRRALRRLRWMDAAEKDKDYRALASLDRNEGADLATVAKWVGVDKSSDVTNIGNLQILTMFSAGVVESAQKTQQNGTSGAALATLDAEYEPAPSAIGATK
ncbi:MAG: hypothetical protein ACKVQA_21145 [Burkholderiales bacterium]